MKLKLISLLLPFLFTPETSAMLQTTTPSQSVTSQSNTPLSVSPKKFTPQKSDQSYQVTLETPKAEKSAKESNKDATEKLREFFLTLKKSNQEKLEELKQIIKEGADINCKIVVSDELRMGETNELTPLSYMLQKYSTHINYINPITLYLINHEDVDLHVIDEKYGMNALFFAIQSNNINAVKELLTKKDLNLSQTNKLGQTVLQFLFATQSGMESSLNNGVQIGYEMLKILVACPRLDINQKGAAGCTALHSAAGRSGNIIDQLLARTDIDLNSKDDQDNTPLHRACMNIRERSHGLSNAQKLVNKGAKLTIKNKDGVTALNIVICRWIEMNNETPTDQFSEPEYALYKSALQELILAMKNNGANLNEPFYQKIQKQYCITYEQTRKTIQDTIQEYKDLCQICELPFKPAQTKLFVPPAGPPTTYSFNLQDFLKRRWAIPATFGTAILYGAYHKEFLSSSTTIKLGSIFYCALACARFAVNRPIILI